MAKEFPHMVVLKKRKCPDCGDETMGHAPFRQDEDVVRAHCPKEGCDFNVELFWMGSSEARNN
ncbi:MAG: hypothetical protein AAB320_03705 [Elusimicrobiota bacterium]